MALFLFGGVFSADTARQAWRQQPNWASPLNLSVLAAGAALLVWNALLYRKATIVDSEFPRSRTDRYLTPVMASACFLAGASLALFK